MENAIMENQVSETNMVVEIEKGEPSQIRCALIKADGNCLLGALAHQLHRYPLQSKEHTDATHSLRQNAIEYIKKNIGLFITSISLRSDFEKVIKRKRIDKKIGLE